MSPFGSSVLHFFLTSTPFLIVLGYFLYCAHKRPSLPIYNTDDYFAYEELYASQARMIKLTDMLVTFLIVFIFWTTMAVYLAIFVPKRRKLMERYTQTNVISVLGNVLFDYPKTCIGKIRMKYSNADYAHVVYDYPLMMNDDAKHYNKLENNRHNDSDPHMNNNNLPADTQLTVEKYIRTYHPYHRENITILILPDYPLSGQPKADVEKDVSTYGSSYAIRNGERLKYILVICAFWILFSISGAWYMTVQMGKFEDAEDDPKRAKIIFIIGVACIAPLIAVGGNILVWWRHYKWVTDRGVVTAHVSKTIPKHLDDEEFYDELQDDECGCENFGKMCDFSRQSTKS